MNCRQQANQVIENKNGKLEKEQEIVQKKSQKVSCAEKS